MPAATPNFRGIARPDYPIPDNETLEGRRCVKIYAPDDPQHLQIMLGTILLLQNFLNYQRNDESRAIAAANMWREIIKEIDWSGSDCDMYRVRVDPTDPCTLQETLDGLTWVDIASASYVRSDGTCPMTGGLEIQSIVNEPSLSILPSASNPGTPLAILARNKAGARIFEIGGDGGYYRVYDSSTVANYVQTVHVSAGDAQLSNVGAGRFFISSPKPLSLQSGNNQGIVIGQAGTLLSAMLGVVSLSATQINMVLKQAVSQTADSFEVVDSGNIKIAAIKAGGAAAFNSQVALQKTTSTTLRDTALFEAAWDVTTDASRAGRFVLSAIDYNSTKEIMRGRADGTQAQVGFLGASPQPRLALTGDCQGNEVTKHIAELLALFGLATDATTLGTPLAPTPFDVVGDKRGNTALQDLISGLDTAGYINDLTSDTGEFTLPDPSEVIGNWNGADAGKYLAVALDEGGYIIDMTELGSNPPAANASLNLRCRGAAAADWIVNEWYLKAGDYMGMALPPGAVSILYPVVDRWGDACKNVEAPLEAHYDDIYSQWATQVFDALHSTDDDVLWDAHKADMLAYLPTIRQAFYCGCDDDGIIAASGLLTIQTLLFADNYDGSVPDDIQTWFYAFFQWFSALDMGSATGAGIFSAYTYTYDCADFTNCSPDEPDWCKAYNFALGTYVPPFELVNGDHVFGAGFNPGWKTNEDGLLRIEFPFPTIEVEISFVVTTPVNASSVIFGTLDEGYSNSLPVDTDGGIYSEVISIPEANRADGWFFQASCDPELCVVTFKSVQNMQGTGDEPSEFNDC